MIAIGFSFHSLNTIYIGMLSEGCQGQRLKKYSVIRKQQFKWEVLYTIMICFRP